MTTLDRRTVLVGSTVAAASVAHAESAERASPTRQFTETTPSAKHYGKYRGTVTNNADPMAIGRLQATVPEVLGTTQSGWSLPCLPAAGPHTGVFSVPPVGAAVWIEFEGGDISRPIWSGGYWPHPSDTPTPSAQSGPGMQNIVLATNNSSLILSDTPGPAGGIVLKSLTGAIIAVNDTGIVISNGKGATVVLAGPTVTINNSHTF